MWYWDEGLSDREPPTPARGVTCWVMMILGMAAFWWAVGTKTAKGAERHPALVFVTQSGGVGYSAGSGICVDPAGFILTAEHCADEPSPVMVQFAGSAPTHSKILYRNKGADLAVLHVPSDGNLPYAPVSLSTPSIGTPVIAEGFPAMVHGRLPGKIKSLDKIDLFSVNEVNIRNQVIVREHFADVFKIDVKTQQGYSGGPIFNTAGEVCGIVSSVPTNEEVWTYCSADTEIRAALEYCGSKGWKKAVNKGEKSLPKAYCLWDRDCPPCLNFVLDYGGKNTAKHPPRSPELRQRIDSFCRLRFVKINNAKKLCKKYGVTAKPAFLISCCDRPILGYNGPEDLLNRIQQFSLTEPLTTATEFEIGPDDLTLCQSDAFFNDDPDFFAVDIQEGGELAQAPPDRRPLIPNPFKRTPQVRQDPATPPSSNPAPRPSPSPGPQPSAADDSVGHQMRRPEEDEEEQDEPAESKPADTKPPDPPVDLSRVTAIVLVKKVIPVGDKLVGFLEEKAKSDVVAKINEALGSKAAVIVVFQRTEPQKYAALLEAAGLSGDSIGDVILAAPVTFTGIAGTVVGLVKEKLSTLTHNTLKNLPVCSVFERTEKDSFDQVQAALAIVSAVASSDEKLFSGGPLSWLAGIAGIQSLGGVLGYLHLWRKSHRAESKADVAVKVVKEV